MEEVRLWNTVLLINSVLCALASFYTIYAAGASIYYLTPRPIEFGALITFTLICTEILFAILEDLF